MKTVRWWIAGAFFVGLVAGCNSTPPSSAPKAATAAPKGAEQKSGQKSGLEHPPPP
jgi:hypothetical protein